MKILNHSIDHSLLSLDLRPRVGIYSSENSPFAIIRPVPYYGCRKGWAYFREGTVQTKLTVNEVAQND